MKKVILLFISIGLNLVSYSEKSMDSENDRKPMNQSEGDEKCFNESSHIFNLSAGIGHPAYYKGISGIKYTSSPAFGLSYEQPWPKRIGPGYIGIGAYLGFQTERYRYSYTSTQENYYYEHRWRYFITAGRAAYHWDVLNKGKFEAYGGIIIGLRTQIYNYSGNDPYQNYREHKNAVYPVLSVFAGARYYFTKKIAAYSELNLGIAYVNIGVSYKF